MRISLVVLLAACGGHSSGGPDAPAVDTPGKVFLVFDGQALQPGAEDATTNTTSVITSPQMMTPFFAQQADRAARIAGIVAGMQSILSPFDLEVVTDRPADGPYDMIIYGGKPQDVGAPMGLGGLTATDCMNLKPSGVALIFGDQLGIGTIDDAFASLGVAALGVMHGIPSTDIANDCMCWAGQACRPTIRCTIGGSGTMISTSDPCRGARTEMDEFFVMKQAFGEAPVAPMP